MDLKTEALNPKWWLVITAIVHTFVGMLSTYDSSNDNETMILGIMLIIPVYMLYAAFMTEGQAQARLAAVIAGPIVVWFLVCAAMGLEVTYATENVTWELSAELIPPLLFWGMTALTGILGWNSSNMDKTVLALKVCGWSSIAMGMIFFLIPEWYAELEGANTENIAWLRNLGAALIAINGVGALLAARDPIAERNLYDVVMLASVLETIALGWSTITWEFSATKEIFITGPLILAALVSIALIILRPKIVEN